MYLGDTILYRSSLGSNQLILAKVHEVKDNTTASVIKYQKRVTGDRIFFSLPSQINPIVIQRNLVYKIGVKLTQAGNIPAVLQKRISAIPL
jgi:hypothetical protein